MLPSNTAVYSLQSIHPEEERTREKSREGQMKTPHALPLSAYSRALTSPPWAGDSLL